MTEEEAKTKWCPFARVLDYGGAAAGFATPNRWAAGDTHKAAPCIGSACMAWRWVPADKSPLVAVAADERAERVGYRGHTKAQKLDIAIRNPPKGIDYNRFDGFCGLAGQP